MSEQNKAIARRFYDEVINKGNLALADALLTHDFMDHGAQGVPMNLEGFKRFATGLAAAFPDLRVTVEDMVAEGDKVAVRVTVSGTHTGVFMGSVQATGKRVTWTGIDIMRLRDGKIAERWNHRDLLGLLQQLGVAPSPGR